MTKSGDAPLSCLSVSGNETEETQVTGIETLVLLAEQTAEMEDALVDELVRRHTVAIAAGSSDQLGGINKRQHVSTT